jgi:hypothetical protein
VPFAERDRDLQQVKLSTAESVGHRYELKAHEPRLRDRRAVTVASSMSCVSAAKPAPAVVRHERPMSVRGDLKPADASAPKPHKFATALDTRHVP